MTRPSKPRRGRGGKCRHRTANHWPIRITLPNGGWYMADTAHCASPGCGAWLSISPSNDTAAVLDELTAIEVAEGERAAFGETSGSFRIGMGEALDPQGWHPAAITADLNTWLRQYQSGAFAAHLIGERGGR